MVVDMEEGDLGELALENHDDLQQEGCLLAGNNSLPDNFPWQLNITAAEADTAGLPSLSLLTCLVTTGPSAHRVHKFQDLGQVKDVDGRAHSSLLGGVVGAPELVAIAPGIERC